MDGAVGLRFGPQCAGLQAQASGAVSVPAQVCSRLGQCCVVFIFTGILVGHGFHRRTRVLSKFALVCEGVGAFWVEASC